VPIENIVYIFLIEFLERWLRSKYLIQVFVATQQRL